MRHVSLCYSSESWGEDGATWAGEGRREENRVRGGALLPWPCYHEPMALLP